MLVRMALPLRGACTFTHGSSTRVISWLAACYRSVVRQLLYGMRCGAEAEGSAAAHRTWQWRLYVAIAAAVCASMTTHRCRPLLNAVGFQECRVPTAQDIPTGIAFYGETSLIGK